MMNQLEEMKKKYIEDNGKVATVLHFVNKDSDWNPHTLTLLDDLFKRRKIN